MRIKYLPTEQGEEDDGYWDGSGVWREDWVPGDFEAVAEMGSYTIIQYDSANIISPVKDPLLNDDEDFSCECLAKRNPSFHENEIVRLSSTRGKLLGIIVGLAPTTDQLTVKRGSIGRYKKQYWDISSIHKNFNSILNRRKICLFG